MNDDPALNLVSAADDADQTMSTDAAGSGVVSCPLPKETGRGVEWVEFQLLQAGVPLANAAYQLAVPDGRSLSGKLDSRGSVRVEDIGRAGDCKIRFPSIDEQKPAGAVEGTPYKPGQPSAGRTGAVHQLAVPQWEVDGLELVLPDAGSAPAGVASAQPATDAPAATEPAEDPWGMDEVFVDEGD